MAIPTSFTQIGLAKVNFATAVLDAYIGNLNQAIKSKHNWKSNILLDSGGFWAAEDARDEHIIITVTMKLSAVSQALAAANGAFLRPLGEVNISGSVLPWLNATGVGGFYTGAWCYHEGASIDLSNAEPGGSEIMLRKFAGSDTERTAVRDSDIITTANDANTPIIYEIQKQSRYKAGR